MTETQKAALARADAQIAPAMELYSERNKLAFLYYRLNLDDLRKLNTLLRELSDDELRQVAAYAQGLADFRVAGQESGDDPGFHG